MLGEPVSFLTLILAGSTIGLWLVTNKTANVARESARALADAERAYVFLFDVARSGSTQNPTFKLIWRNVGKTPAMVTSVRCWCGSADEPPIPQKGERRVLPKGEIIGPDISWERGQHTFTASDSRAGLRDEKVYFCGEIAYLDVLQKKERRTWFCRAYHGRQFVLADLTDEKLNGHT
jgi:hypothetical protein